MIHLKSLARLVRLRNLLIILLTQYFFQYLIILPRMHASEIVPRLDHLHFFLLSVTTVCIGAAGFIINDLWDVNSDHINKPDKVIIGNRISHDQAWVLFILTVITGMLLANKLAFYLGKPVLFMVYPAAVALLVMYSIRFQQIFLLGNAIVAAYCAFVPGIIPIAEWSAFVQLKSADMESYQQLMTLVYGFIIFSFVITLYREIVKDLEDIKGDFAEGQRTLAIVLGTKKSKITISLIAVFLIGIIGFWLFFTGINYSLWNIFYGILFVEVPLIFSLVLLKKATVQKDYNRISQVLKMIMLAGIIYLLFF